MFINGRKVNFVFGGIGEPVIVAFGLFQNCHTDTKVLIELSKHFQVFGLNLPGFGYSESLDELTVENYTSFIDTFSKKLKITQFNLVGFSYGGMLGLKYASANANKIKKLVVAGSPISTSVFPRYIKHLCNCGKWFYEKIGLARTVISCIIINDSLLSIILKQLIGFDPEDKSVYKQTVDNLRKMNLKDLNQIFGSLMNLDIENDCKKIKNKTLIVAGLKDSLISLGSLRRLPEMIRDSALIEVDSKHWDLRLKTPVEKIIEFLKS